MEETKNFVSYLCIISDWRMKPKVLDSVRSAPDIHRFFIQDAEYKELLDATAQYYDNGLLPEQHLIKHEDLPLVHSQTISEHLQKTANQAESDLGYTKLKVYIL